MPTASPGNQTDNNFLVIDELIIFFLFFEHRVVDYYYYNILLLYNNQSLVYSITIFPVFKLLSIVLWALMKLSADFQSHCRTSPITG